MTTLNVPLRSSQVTWQLRKQQLSLQSFVQVVMQLIVL